ncbi:MAG: hypothetical protein KDI36_05235, partial [Pseudomonadales bacterium]|nr:hypothetical protein [Pseudomonadales bacterium]
MNLDLKFPGLSSVNPINNTLGHAMPAPGLPVLERNPGAENARLLLAQVVGYDAASKELLVRLPGTEQQLILPQASARAPGDLLILREVLGKYTIESSQSALSQVLLRILKPHDINLSQVLSRLMQLATPAGATQNQTQPGSPVTAANPATGTSLAQNLNTTGQSSPGQIASHSLSAGPASVSATGASSSALSAPPATNSSMQNPLPQTGSPTGADGSIRVPLPATAAPVPDKALALARSLAGRIPDLTALNATVIRDFVRLSTPFSAPATSRPQTEPQGIPQLLLQLLKASAPVTAGGPQLEGPARSLTMLRELASDAMGKLLLNQLQPLLARSTEAEPDHRRADLLIRNEGQLDTIGLQISRQEQLIAPVHEKEPEQPEEAADKKSSQWKVRLNFDLPQL